MDLHCFDADPEPDPDPAQNLDVDPDPDPDPGGEGVGQPKMCIPPGKILGTPLTAVYSVNIQCTVTPTPRNPLTLLIQSAELRTVHSQELTI